MANMAAKKLAVTNKKALDQLHVSSVVVFFGAFALNWLLHRPLKRFVFLSVPALVAQYSLEKSGRPRYRDGQLVAAGSDQHQSGLTEYLYDVVYVTWICAILSVVFGPKAWYLYFSVPAFALYKAWQLIQGGRQLLGGGAPSHDPVETTPSRRQEKLQKLQKRRARTQQ